MNFHFRRICFHFSAFSLLAILYPAAAGLFLVTPLQSQAQTAAPTKTQPLPHSFTLYGDSFEAVQKGLVAYAVAPLSEQQLKLRDGTPNEFSVTVPLIVDEKTSKIFVFVSINGKKVRLRLDTGGCAGITLNKNVAVGIALKSPISVNHEGLQGFEPATEGTVQSVMLGALNIAAVDTVVRHEAAPDDFSILGLEIFTHYWVTLDFAEKKMTLSRGGVPSAAGKGEISQSFPFTEENGQIFVPVHVLDKPAWAQVDSGCDANILSLTLAKIIAARVPGKSIGFTSNQKAGTGSTKPEITALVMANPIPILLDFKGSPTSFGTTSQMGESAFNDEANIGADVHTGVNLGAPFFLQFRRVIIDYPNHMLTLQGARHGAPRNISPFAPYPGKPWPGYKWQRSGDGYVEVLK